jgi:hypothetical protein
VQSAAATANRLRLVCQNGRACPLLLLLLPCLCLVQEMELADWISLFVRASESSLLLWVAYSVIMSSLRVAEDSRELHKQQQHQQQQQHSSSIGN